MCTAITYYTKNHYFGRNLDFEHDFGESIVVTPRNYKFTFQCGSTVDPHPSMIGMAVTDNDYPLYFDAVNEDGLCMAGLYFPGNAVYLQAMEDMYNIAPYEFIPWVLCQCRSVQEAKKLLHRTNLVNIPYSEDYPQAPLHWFIADRTSAITVEPGVEGLVLYDNPIGVLTNNPPFPYHMHNLNNYLNVTSDAPTSRFAPDYTLTPYSRGMGGMGLPGDLSSASRFVRAAFTKLNSVSDDCEDESVTQFFHILGSVIQQKGCVKVGNGYEKTIYSSCCNIDKGIYYYTTYENPQISAVYLKNTDYIGNRITKIPLLTELQVRIQHSY